MEKNTLTKALQEILIEDPYYFLPKQLHVLSWKSKKIEGALITKINGRRYLGLPKKDKTGQSYWCYKLLTDSAPLSEQKSPAVPLSSNSESVSQEKALEYSPSSSQKGLEDSECSPNSFDKGLEAVKKFKEKYGTASEPKRSEQ